MKGMNAHGSPGRPGIGTPSRLRMGLEELEHEIADENPEGPGTPFLVGDS